MEGEGGSDGGDAVGDGGGGGGVLDDTSRELIGVMYEYDVRCSPCLG